MKKTTKSKAYLAIPIIILTMILIFVICAWVGGTPITQMIDASPLPHTAYPSDEPKYDESYAKLAEDVGWSGGRQAIEVVKAESNKAAERNEFVHWLNDNKIPVYDEQRVQKYLDKLVLDKNTQDLMDHGSGQYSWQWFPLSGRDLSQVVQWCDKGTCQYSGVALTNTTAWTTGDSDVVKVTYGDVVKSDQSVVQQIHQDYTAPIPADVLSLMKKVRDEWPCAEFDVTAISRNMDPFIRVRFDWGTEIIAKWDEPGF